MFLSSREVFGQTMEPAFLLDRVRSYGWKGSATRLARLATFTQAPQRTAEEIRARTIDPILTITGDARAQRLIAHAHAFIHLNRARMRIAHEEVISYLMHLVLVEGGDQQEEPSDAELAFWILGANCHLGDWAEPDSRELSIDEQLIAVQVRGHCFNKNHHWAALAVRSYELFRHCPEDDSFGGPGAWVQMQLDTFGAPFERYYSLVLAPLLAISWGSVDTEHGVPAVGVEYWTSTGADLDWIKARLDAIAVTRDDARTQILAADNARDENGLLHAPTLLRRRPLVVDDGGYLITSPAAIGTQFHAGPWGAYLERSKRLHGDRVGFQRWSSAFGVAFERYCAELARAAGDSRRFRRNWRMILPNEPGTADEIEDVILIEDDHAVLFSIKSRLLPEGAIHRAKSRSAVLDWLEQFVFADDRTFKGAVRKLSANVDEIRRGEHDARGVTRDLRIHPVLVTYDEIGEDVFLYRHLRKRCSALNLLRQTNVTPLTLASVEEFESMMEYVRDGRSLVGLLKKRKHDRPWFDRRLDQQLDEVRPALSFKAMKKRFFEVFGEVLTAVRGGRPPDELPVGWPTDLEG